LIEQNDLNTSIYTCKDYGFLFVKSNFIVYRSKRTIIGAVLNESVFFYSEVFLLRSPRKLADFSPLE